MDAFLTRLYERLGAWYVVTFVAAVAVNALIGLAIGIVALSSFLSPTSSELLRITLVAVLAAAMSLALCVWLLLPQALRLIRWSAAPNPAAAPEIWTTTATIVPRAVRTGIVVFSVLFVPVLVYGRAVVDVRWSAFPAGYAAIEAAILFAATLDYFAMELLFRPLRREAAAYLPATFEPDHHPITLRTRLLAVIFVASLSASVLVASAETWVESPEAKLTIGVGLGLLVAASVGLLPATVLARSEGLSRRSLVDAARKVERGDLDAAIPLVAADETAALAASFNRMLLGLKEREELRDRNVVLDAALQASLEEVRASRARIVAAADAARRRMERDLHDGAQQQLVLLQLKLGLLEAKLADDPEATLAVADLRQDLSRALQELRDLAHGIYPALLQNDGLAAALRDATERAAIPAELACDGIDRYPPELEAAVYFCCLEALQNAAKHAGEDARATVRLAQRDDALLFEVADDGRGCDVAEVPEGTGMQNMADRIGALGGSLRIDSAPGRGTTVRGEVPLASGAS